MIRVLILAAAALAVVACAGSPPPTTVRPSPTVRPSAITTLPEQRLTATPVAYAACSTCGLGALQAGTASSTAVVTVWDAKGASTTTADQLVVPPAGLAIVLENGCVVRLDYVTGDVSQHGACAISDVAEVFWRGVNRYNPNVMGAQHEVLQLQVPVLQRRADDLKFEVAAQERYRDDLRSQVALLNQTLAVLKSELELYQASELRSQAEFLDRELTVLRDELELYRTPAP